MWMGICYLLFYEHVSAAVWFVCEGAVCLDSLGERQCFKDVDGCMLLALFSVWQEALTEQAWTVGRSVVSYRHVWNLVRVWKLGTGEQYQLVCSGDSQIMSSCVFLFAWQVLAICECCAVWVGPGLLSKVLDKGFGKQLVLWQSSMNQIIVLKG